MTGPQQSLSVFRSAANLRGERGRLMARRELLQSTLDNPIDATRAGRLDERIGRLDQEIAAADVREQEDVS